MKPPVVTCAIIILDERLTISMNVKSELLTSLKRLVVFFKSFLKSKKDYR